MLDLSVSVDQWLAQAASKLRDSPLTADDLLELRQILAHHRARRQRLLYLHAATLSIYSNVVAAVLHEPVHGAQAQIDATVPELPYARVFDAILDGWRVVHFPDQRAPFDDREIDVLGYEFILEKWTCGDA